MRNLARDKYLIDVRTPTEFATGSLNGANNVEYQNVAQFLVDNQRVAKGTEVTLFCRSGRRSAIAKAELEALGFINVKDWGSLEDARAMFEKVEKEGTVVKADAEQPPVVLKAEKAKLERSTKTLLEGLRRLE
jgi:rhodanese-related sulfurtransferase